MEQKSKKFFSIRYKFLAVTTMLLGLCVASYLIIAIDALKSDKEELVFDYKKNLVSSISSEIESVLKKSVDNIKLVSFFYRSKQKENLEIIKNILQNDSEVVSVWGSSNYLELESDLFQNQDYSQTYGIDKDYYVNEVLREKPIPFSQIKIEGEAMWNATISGGPPLIGYGKSIIEENSKGQPVGQFAIIVFVRADNILKHFYEGKINEVYVLGENGNILIHPNSEIMSSSKTLKDDFIFNKANTESIQHSVFKYNKGEMFGAYSKSFSNKIIVILKVSSEKAFSAVTRLVYRSLLFAMIVFTLIFIAAILFSSSLTRPIERLMNAMKKVSEGNLNSNIEVNSSDEINVLGLRFNEMIQDLKVSREKLEEINKNLEKKVLERTQELQERNEAVKKAQEALLRTTRLAAVGEIAGQTAHEVLNPLTIMLTKIQKLKQRMDLQIKADVYFLNDLTTCWSKDFEEGGFKQLIESWEEGSKVDPRNSIWDEDLENLKKMAKHLEDEAAGINQEADFLIKEGMRINKIVQKMRTLSTVVNDPQIFPVNRLLEESKKVMADLASQMNSRINIQGLESATVKVDEDEFMQVMVNLIRNSLHAIKAKKKSEPQLEGAINLKVNEDNDKVNICIEDNGIGIHEDIQNKIFESHFSTKPTHEGTGLGLGISRRLIRAFGGDLYLKKSSETSGAMFIIELPKASIENEKRAA